MGPPFFSIPAIKLTTNNGAGGEEDQGLSHGVKRRGRARVDSKRGVVGH